MVKTKNLVILIEAALFFKQIFQQMVFTKIWQKMLRQDLTLQILKQRDHYLKERLKELGGQIMKEFVGLKAKAYSYLKLNNDDDKKSKRHKKVSHENK